MRNLGREYGKGLQLINILRDAGSDLANGRCYFPEEELKACGVAPNEMISRRSDVAPILEKWRRKAEQGIAAGMDYCCAIRSARVRFATALPALIGARTLALLREAGVDALQQKIKVPRSEVRAIMSSTTMTLASPRALRRNFERICSRRAGRADKRFSDGHRPRLQSREIIPLLFRDRSLQSLEHLQHVFPNFSFFRRRLIAQQIRRVIRDHERRVFVGMPAATQFAHRPAKAEQGLPLQSRRARPKLWAG